MRMMSIRSGRMCRILLLCLFILPVLYLLSIWNNINHTLLPPSQQHQHYQQQINSPEKKKSNHDVNFDVPTLVEGNIILLLIVIFFTVVQIVFLQL